ncbi:MAG: hypothetical protein ACR2PZ_18210 [Pseudomonadales bacterium]
MAKQSSKPALKQRVAERVSLRAQQAAAASDNPRLLWVWVRAGLLRMWRLRGGGFYGLGFVATFVVLQLGSLFADASEAAGPVDFLTSQLSEAIIRLTGDSIGNLVKAFLWPIYFVVWAGAYGLLALLTGFLIFDRWLKPWINDQFPEEPVAPHNSADSET